MAKSMGARKAVSCITTSDHHRLFRLLETLEEIVNASKVTTVKGDLREGEVKGDVSQMGVPIIFQMGQIVVFCWRDLTSSRLIRK